MPIGLENVLKCVISIKYILGIFLFASVSKVISYLSCFM